LEQDIIKIYYLKV